MAKDISISSLIISVLSLIVSIISLIIDILGFGTVTQQLENLTPVSSQSLSSVTQTQSNSNEETQVYRTTSCATKHRYILIFRIHR